MEKFDYREEVKNEIYEELKFSGLNGRTGTIDEIANELEFDAYGWMDSFTNASGMYTKGSSQELLERINQNGMLIVEAMVDTTQTLEEIDSNLREWVYHDALIDALVAYNNNLKIEVLSDKDVFKLDKSVVRQIEEEFDEEERMYDIDEFIERCEEEIDLSKDRL